MVWNTEGKGGGLSILEFPKTRGGLDEDGRYRYFLDSPNVSCSCCRDRVSKFLIGFWGLFLFFTKNLFVWQL